VDEAAIDALCKSVCEKITEDRFLDLAAALIKAGQPLSGNALDPDMPGAQEEAIALFVAGKLEALGQTVTLHEKTRHRPNVLGRIGGSDGPSLMINDHLDTYPVVEPEKWHMTDFDPYKATRHGDVLYGRGTSDTRANMAAALLAVQVLHEAGLQYKGELLCCFTVDEERDGTDGSIYMTEELGLNPDYSITAEPTAWGGPEGPWGMSISTANSGHCLVNIDITGVKGHIWRPDIVANPILEAAKLLPEIEKMAFEHVPHMFMGHTPPCCSVVRIRSGLDGEMQFSPDHCRITLAVVGIVPEMTMESVLGDIQSVCNQVCGGSNEISIAATQTPGSLFVPGTDPVPDDQEPCVTLRRVYRDMMGEEPKINRKNAFNDTIRFRQAGINAVTFGPGEDGWAADNEWISIPKSIAAAKIYAQTIIRILGVKDPV
jgi:acetylornithine deacetylase/succinyl-diaminopimelate desuccinylase-like protein